MWRTSKITSTHPKLRRCNRLHMEAKLKRFIIFMEKHVVEDNGNGPFSVDEKCEQLRWVPETCCIVTPGCDAKDPTMPCCSEGLELVELYEAVKELLE